jgi:hypothetical protein
VLPFVCPFTRVGKFRASGDARIDTAGEKEPVLREVLSRGGEVVEAKVPKACDLRNDLRLPMPWSSIFGASLLDFL